MNLSLDLSHSPLSLSKKKKKIKNLPTNKMYWKQCIEQTSKTQQNKNRKQSRIHAFCAFELFEVQAIDS